MFASDSLRLGLESLHEADGGPDLLIAELSGLLRAAAADESLAAERRLRAIEMAAQWREHILTAQIPSRHICRVGDVAARFGVTTQAVYKWLAKERIEATRGPGGSWRIPVAQFDKDKRPARTRNALDKLQHHLTELHGSSELPSEEDLGSQMRAEI